VFLKKKASNFSDISLTSRDERVVSRAEERKNSAANITVHNGGSHPVFRTNPFKYVPVQTPPDVTIEPYEVDSHSARSIDIYEFLKGPPPS
jgi:hypothetical protein